MRKYSFHKKLLLNILGSNNVTTDEPLILGFFLTEGKVEVVIGEYSEVKAQNRILEVLKMLNVLEEFSVQVKLENDTYMADVCEALILAEILSNIFENYLENIEFLEDVFYQAYGERLGKFAKIIPHVPALTGYVAFRFSEGYYTLQGMLSVINDVVFIKPLGELHNIRYTVKFEEDNLIEHAIGHFIARFIADLNSGVLDLDEAESIIERVIPLLASLGEFDERVLSEWFKIKRIILNKTSGKCLVYPMRLGCYIYLIAFKFGEKWSEVEEKLFEELGFDRLIVLRGF